MPVFLLTHPRALITTHKESVMKKLPIFICIHENQRKSNKTIVKTAIIPIKNEKPFNPWN